MPRMLEITVALTSWDVRSGSAGGVILLTRNQLELTLYLSIVGQKKNLTMYLISGLVTDTELVQGLHVGVLLSSLLHIGAFVKQSNP